MKLKNYMVLNLFSAVEKNRKTDEEDLIWAARGDIGYNNNTPYVAYDPSRDAKPTGIVPTRTVEESLTAPEYGYTPGSFGYGPFTYGDFSYKDQALLDAAKQKVNNFSYNPDEDTSYKAYARQYTRNGEDALRNTMARLASRTGGVASSYAVQAAQGAYNNYMQELANKVPELSELAYQKLQNEYNLYNTEYNRDLAKWKADRDFAYNQYEDAKDIAYKNFQLQEAAREAAYKQNYNRKLDAYNSAVEALKETDKKASNGTTGDYKDLISTLKGFKDLDQAINHLDELGLDLSEAEQIKLLQSAGYNPLTDTVDWDYVNRPVKNPTRYAGENIIEKDYAAGLINKGTYEAALKKRNAIK